ncbi:MAG TPA: GntR family transcriptional regulator [Verrucomicrobiae bacterium]|nr:GntR family transcriptional regulator [Verrucomicrobiae bacterium]
MVVAQIVNRVDLLLSDFVYTFITIESGEVNGFFRNLTPGIAPAHRCGPMLSVDHKSPIPLRAQVEQLLRDLIVQPEYQKGALLPDEVALAAQLGVSRGTVRSGISKLVFEGMLERKAGVGTRVSTRNLESGITAWRSFTREMASKGIKVENFRVEYRHAKASADAARALHVEPDTLLRCLNRVRGWDGKPVLQTTSWFHPRIGLKGTEDITRPLYEMIEKTTGVRPRNAREEFLAVSADAALARVLDVSRGTPLLLRRHTVFDQGSRPFEFAEVHYVSSRFALTLDMRRGEA